MSRLLLLLFPVALLVVAALAWIALNEPIRSVRVEGMLADVEQRAIREVVTRSLGEPLLSLDLEQVKARIRSLSWPREVSIRRVWPATLLIIVEKESAVAKWGADAFLTSDARVVQLSEVDVELPSLDCKLSTPRAAMEVFHNLQAVLTDHDLLITMLAENTSGEWQVTLNNGVTVMLGNERLLDRTRRFALVYGRALANRTEQVAHVDARYTNGVAVGWRPVNSVAMVN